MRTDTQQDTRRERVCESEYVEEDEEEREKER
jgi:hypothetical protein